VTTELAPLDEPTWEWLLEAADTVRRHAERLRYARYSDFHVGAALLTANGTIVRGCNVENASYGLTMCAERTAIFTAASLESKHRLEIRALVISSQTPASPCGACRQVLAAFGPHAVVSFLAQDGRRRMAVGDLLPEAFGLDGA
jgi:cytidine deaminase